MEGSQKRTSKWVRLFVALELPGGLREQIDAWAEEAFSDPALRRVRAESLHITCAFLGQRPCEEVDAIAAEVRASAGPAPEVRLGRPVKRPARGRARFYALPARSEGAVALQAELAERLAESGFFKPDKRPFWPHVTVARVRSDGAGPPHSARLVKPPRELPEALSKPFKAVRLGLYLSESQPRGARYVPLANVELSEQGSSEVI